MDDRPADLAQQITQLTTAIQQLQQTRDLLPEAMRAGIDANLAELQHRLAALQGQATVSGGKVFGSVVGVNQGVILAFYGTQLPADAAELLDSYLQSLLSTYGPLKLGRLLQDQRNSRDEANAPPMQLREVYTSIATNHRVVLDAFELPPDDLRKALDNGSPAWQLPEQVRLAQLHKPDEREYPFAAIRCTLAGAEITEQWNTSVQQIPGLRDGRGARCTADTVTGHWFRPQLAVEAIATERRLVLLGSPGSGKSTVLRYLVVALEEALRGGRTKGLDQLGWEDRALPVPIFCALGAVAKALTSDPAQDYDILVAAILRTVTGGAVRAGLDQSMLHTWRKGGALLLLDGLDEISGVDEPTARGDRSRRQRIANAIQQLADQVGDTRIVVTCRTKPYEQDRAWQLREGWTVRTLEPFARGQIDHFAVAWYHEASTKADAKYTPDEVTDRLAALQRALQTRPRLLAIMASPLLLTMVLLLHYNKTQLPEERADVYEELVKLLLERWESVRSSDRDRVEREPIGVRLGLPRLIADDLRQPIHEIAFDAHAQAVDGRGIVTEAVLRKRLFPFFAPKIDPLGPERVPKKALATKMYDLIEVLCDESGLLQAEADDAYALPHLTFEEYLAACYLATRDNVQPIYDAWVDGADRWREPIFLLMRRLVTLTKGELAYSWLTRLLPSRSEFAQPLLLQRQRDVILAAACYDALGRADFVAGLGRSARDFEDDLRAALLHVLANPSPDLA